MRGSGPTLAPDSLVPVREPMGPRLAGGAEGMVAALYVLPVQGLYIVSGDGVSRFPVNSCWFPFPCWSVTLDAAPGAS
jgi:hypothetical protein